MIQHKISKEIIEDLPNYGKHFYSIYGWLVLTKDNKVYFFYPVSEPINCECDDVTSEYIIVG